MGTTLTLVLINNKCAYATHIGDSRIYQLRSAKKVYRSFDDSVVFQLVKSGAITEEEARTAGNSNIITKALGIGETVEFDIVILPYDKGDRFILCSDGFWGAMQEKELLQRIGDKKDLRTAFELTINKVEMEGRKNHPGSYDNYTAIVFDINQYSKMRSQMEKRIKITAILLFVLLLASISLNVYQYRRAHQSNKQTDQGATDIETIVSHQDSTAN
jgi:protein phosphatase